VLVGLYFAVAKHHAEDGEIWALYPEALNKHNGYFGLPLPKCKILNYLAAEPSQANLLQFLRQTIVNSAGCGRIFPVWHYAISFFAVPRAYASPCRLF
jgi:hypothetical protein